jgi:hypothetical protein
MLPKPFKINPSSRSASSGYANEPTMEHFRVAHHCNIDAEIVRKGQKLYLRVSLYYKGIKIMQNNYDIDPKEVAKL